MLHFSLFYSILKGLGTPLFLQGNLNEYGLQLFRDYYIHLNEAFKTLIYN